MDPTIADRIAPALPQFEESEQPKGPQFSAAVAPDPTADRVQVDLTCPACAAKAESATTMLRPEPTGRMFMVGNRWPMRADLVNGYWFLDVRMQPPGVPLVVLDGDCCGACGTDLWFELTFDSGVLSLARQTQLTTAALDRCHVCTTRTKLVAAAMVGGDAGHLPAEDALQILRTHLKVAETA